MSATSATNNHNDSLHQAPPRMTAARALAMVALLAAALWLGWKAWDVNTTMSCWKDEWPHLKVCEEIMGRTPEEQVAKLQERLTNNPGDSEALVLLTVWANRPGGFPGLDAEALLNAAGKAAPQNPNVLLLQATTAMRAQRWPEAIERFGRLAQFHRDANASLTLARLIGLADKSAPLNDALLAAAKADGGWLTPVFYAMPKAKVPMAAAVPLVTELMATQQLEPRLGQFVIGQLKREGLWMEAHAVWRSLWNRPLDLVFNGDFEQPFVRGGFDWEVADANDHRSGARIDLVSRSDRGQVLKVEFTGKAMRTPILRQDMLLLPGRYVLRGAMRSTDLRSEKGLAWVVSCNKDGRELGRTAALKTTGREWAKWEALIEMPPDCSGFGARLALQPFAPYEAKTGLRGEALFDALCMEQDKGTP